MPILPIPGENKWGNESYEVIKDIQLVKIKKEN
jgi:hypothetical protein